jgi:ferredoxin-NADP reductase
MNDQTSSSYLIQEIVQENSAVRSYTFDFGLASFAFKPGQFCVTQLESSSTLMGALSLTSSPLDKKEFTLTVRRTGNFGSFIYDNARVGSLLKMRPPAGTFELNLQSSVPICFIARDYTVTAARSFFRFLAITNPHRPFFLLQELSHSSELLFTQEFCSKALTNFKWITIGPDPVRTGEPEHVTGAINARLIMSIFPFWKEAEYYIAAEGIDAKRYKGEMTLLGVENDRLKVERWS